MSYYSNKKKDAIRTALLGAFTVALCVGLYVGDKNYKATGPTNVRNNAAMHVHKRANPEIERAMLPLSARPSSNAHFTNNAQSALVMDSQSGDISYAKNADKLRKVASTGKLMTLYLAQRKAQQEHAWNAKVTVPKNISRMSYDDKDGIGSEMKLKVGHQYTVRDLYQAALIESSDSASVLLGEWVSGDNVKFVHLMNQQARAWHLGGHFISASGLENDSISKFGLKVAGGKTDGNMLSAKDLAIIGQHLLKEFPQITKWSSEQSAKVDGTTMTNLNYDLPGTAHSTNGCDGLKTGFTPSAGYCFVGTKKQGNSHRIIVLLNDSQVFSDGHKLLQ